MTCYQIQEEGSEGEGDNFKKRKNLLKCRIYFFLKEEGENRFMKAMFNISRDQDIIQCRNCLVQSPAETGPFQEESTDS